MAPQTRGMGRAKGSVTLPSTSTHAVNTHGFATLADEIYLQIVSYIPSVPIPTSIDLKSYPEIRRSRHETFLSLSQTSRSLRRFFWRYLWQRIEVREGMKIGDRNVTLKGTRTRAACEKYATELVRQLEIVTIRNPQLAQYVNYLDIFIGEYSAKTVLTELARCLNLFQNLHTVQIDIDLNYIRLPFEGFFEQSFKKYSYPQIRNIFVMDFSVSFITSCPQARRVGFTRNRSFTPSSIFSILNNCPRPSLEVLDDIGDNIWIPNLPNQIVQNFPNLRSIKFTMYSFTEDYVGNPSSHIDILKELNHLQTIIMRTPPPIADFWQEEPTDLDRMNEYWIEAAKHILIHIQLRDNLEKTVVVLEDYDDNERRILLKPNPH